MMLAHGMQAIEDLNRRTGADVDPNADPNQLMQANTRGLMSAVASLPELTERKRTIDKHTAVLTKLLDCIKNRGLDKLYSLEDSAIQGKCDLPGILSVIQVSVISQTSPPPPPSASPPQVVPQIHTCTHAFATSAPRQHHPGLVQSARHPVCQTGTDCSWTAPSRANASCPGSFLSSR